MRMLLTARMDTEAADRAVSDGSMAKMLEEVVARLRPEAAYFTPTEGVRTCMFVFDMADSAELPPVTEPFFHAGAQVSVQPVMNLDDLRTGLGSLTS